jgi:hypothetical protein
MGLLCVTCGLQVLEGRWCSLCRERAAARHPRGTVIVNSQNVERIEASQDPEEGRES